MTRQPAGTMVASDAWSRAAQRVRALAEHLGYWLDEQEIVLLDVHDLHRFEDRLERARGRHAAGAQVKRSTDGTEEDR